MGGRMTDEVKARLAAAAAAAAKRGRATFAGYDPLWLRMALDMFLDDPDAGRCGYVKARVSANGLDCEALGMAWTYSPAVVRRRPTPAEKRLQPAPGVCYFARVRRLRADQAAALTAALPWRPYRTTAYAGPGDPARAADVPLFRAADLFRLFAILFPVARRDFHGGVAVDADRLREQMDKHVAGVTALAAIRSPGDGARFRTLVRLVGDRYDVAPGTDLTVRRDAASGACYWEHDGHARGLMPGGGMNPIAVSFCPGDGPG